MELGLSANSCCDSQWYCSVLFTTSDRDTALSGAPDSRDKVSPAEAQWPHMVHPTAVPAPHRGLPNYNRRVKYVKKCKLYILVDNDDWTDTINDLYNIETMYKHRYIYV